MADNKTAVKEAITAIRGGLATYRAFEGAAAVLNVLTTLDSTRESMELRIVELQKELDALVKKKGTIAAGISAAEGKLEEQRAAKMAGIETQAKAYAEALQKKQDQLEFDLAAKMVSLEGKKAALETEIKGLEEIVRKRDDVLMEIGKLEADRKKEEERLAKIQAAIAALKNRL